MPDEDLFTRIATMSQSEGYHATLLHEMTHWSGSKGRLVHDLSRHAWQQPYATEELVAEVGTAFPCAEIEITPALRPDQAQS